MSHNLGLRLLAGTLWLTTIALGAGFGQALRPDVVIFADRAENAIARLADDGWMAFVAVACAVVLAAAGTALAALALGRLVEALWLAGPYTPGSWPLIRLRRRRWKAADSAAAAARKRGDAEAFDRAMARRNRICLSPPAAPAWAWDEITARETRVRDEYGLDIASAWPHLLILAPRQVRDDSRRAHATWARAAETAGWSVLFLLAGLWWWPAALAGVGGYVLGRRAGRMAWREYAALVEAVADLYTIDFAAALKIPVPEEWPDPHVGAQITDRLRKGA